MIWRKDGKLQAWHRRFRGLPWLALAAAIGASSPAPTLAQDGAFDMGALTATLSTDNVTQAERARSINDQIFNPPPSPVPATGAAFTYRYDRARTRQNLRNFIARTPVEAGRAELERQLAAQPGLMDEISAGARSFGFDPHDVADAYAMWWMNAWLVASKHDEVPDAATVEAVKRQVRNAFAATPDFAKTSDAERQEYAEALLLQATMLGSAFEQLKNDPRMLDQLANAAHQGAKASGIDLSRMSLTQSGFVPREAK